MIKVFKFFLLIFIISFSNSYSKEVAIIDLDFLIANSNKGKLILENIKKLDEKNVKELKIKSDKLVELENEIKSKQNIISSDAYNKEIKLFKEKVSLYRKEKNQLVEDFNNYRNNELNNFFESISPIVRDFMDKNSIEILFDKKKIFMGKNNVDITGQILKEINNSIN